MDPRRFRTDKIHRPQLHFLFGELHEALSNVIKRDSMSYVEIFFTESMLKSYGKRYGFPGTFS